MTKCQFRVVPSYNFWSCSIRFTCAVRWKSAPSDRTVSERTASSSISFVFILFSSCIKFLPQNLRDRGSSLPSGLQLRLLRPDSGNEVAAKLNPVVGLCTGTIADLFHRSNFLRSDFPHAVPQIKFPHRTYYNCTLRWLLHRSDSHTVSHKALGLFFHRVLLLRITIRRPDRAGKLP